MSAISLARVQGVSLREVYETEDEDYLAFVESVVRLTIDKRNEIAEEQKRQAR